MKYAWPIAVMTAESMIGLMPRVASAASRLGSKLPGLHITAATPPGYDNPRVPRVVRGFNPNQKVRGPKKEIGLARRR